MAASAPGRTPRRARTPALRARAWKGWTCSLLGVGPRADLFPGVREGMAWRPSCEQGGRSSVLVAPIRVAGRRVAVVRRYADGAMWGATRCVRFRRRGGPLLSAIVARPGR